MSAHPVSMPRGVALTALGGALGAVARWALEAAFPASGVAFPWATFAINISGSGLLALLGLLPVVRRRPALPVFLGTGVLGGYTTMSAAAVDTVRLVDQGAQLAAASYALGTLGAALLVAALLVRLDPTGEHEADVEGGDL